MASFVCTEAGTHIHTERHTKYTGYTGAHRVSEPSGTNISSVNVLSRMKN